MTDYTTFAHAERQRLTADPHRPIYHFLPPSQWMNDPNGVIQWQGQTHLFYQHHPDSPLWGPMHWGHAVSDDLVHWRDLPVALCPTPESPDSRGCWSGCMVDDGGVPTILYTGVRGEHHHIQTQCLVTGSADLLTWEKYVGNPVIAAPPDGKHSGRFRDPYVWREGDLWYMVLGMGQEDSPGKALLYRSHDLRAWEYLHPLLEGYMPQHGMMWECPNFLPLGDKHLLLVSIIGPTQVYYFLGTYADQHFTPEREGVLDLNSSFYAPLTLRDAQGRWLMFGWLREGRPDEALLKAGWAGVQALPRVLSLLPNGTIGMMPIPEIRKLRGQHFTSLEAVQGQHLELNVEFPGHASDVHGIIVRRSPDGAEETRIGYEPAGEVLFIDRSLSSLDENVQRDRATLAFIRAKDEPLRLHIYLDASVIEVFANDRACLTSRVYPTRADSLGLATFGAVPTQVDVWEMRSIWGG